MARYVWRNNVVESNGVVKWDVQSVNTCPENFRWEHGVEIRVERAGLYEVTMAFFSRKGRKPVVQVVQNHEDVILQSVYKVACNTCGQKQNGKNNGQLQKMGNGVYKVAFLDFILVKDRTVLTVAVNDMANNEVFGIEGFIGLRKL